MNGPDRRRINAALQALEREKGLTELTCLPVELQIEATNRCRRNCPTCARNFYDRTANAPGDLSPAVLDALAPLLPYAQTVLVGGYGEPLLAEITDEILRRAKAAGCATTIITGGGELDEQRAARLIAAGLDEIVLSVDAADDERMRLRRGVSLHEVLANLQRLRERRPTLHTVFNVTLQVDNLDELPAIVALAGAHNIHEVRVFHQKIYSRTQADSSALGVAEHTRLVFYEAEQAAREHGVALSLPPLAGTTRCEQPYRLLAVRHDGLVQGCCSALFEAQVPRPVLGRLPDDDPLALWNHPAMLAARSWTLGEGPADFACAACAFRVYTVAAHRRFLEADDE
ncbi:MAG TPA: radical SAM protein [bacterium]|nr:radical SAM protein [bacterium]